MPTGNEPRAQFPGSPLSAGIDITDVYQHGKYAANLKRLVRTGRDGDISLLQVDHDAGDASDAPMKDFMLFMSQVDGLHCQLDAGACSSGRSRRASPLSNPTGENHELRFRDDCR